MTDLDREPAGIGGWLALFLLLLALVAAMLAGDLAAYLFSRVEIGSALFELALLQRGIAASNAIALLLCILMGWRLVAIRNPRTIRLVLACLWLIGLGRPVLKILLGRAAGFERYWAYDSAVAGVTALVLCLPWTFYFLRSRRVANTYRRPGETAAIAGIFS